MSENTNCNFKDSADASNCNSKELLNFQVDLNRLEFLCKIKIPSDQKEQVVSELEKIQSKIISKILTIECEVKPMASVHEYSLYLAEDVVAMRNTREDIFDMTPSINREKIKANESFLVPKVL